MQKVESGNTGNKNPKKFLKAALAIAGLFVPLSFVFYPSVIYPLASLVITGCVAPQPYEQQRTPLPEYPDLYRFPDFKIPEKKKTMSVPLTVAVVKPVYNKEAVVIGEGGMTMDMLKVFKSFANSIGEDVQEQIVAKGMLTKGPYDDLEAIPYPDRKATNLTVSTLVVFSINYDRPRIDQTRPWVLFTGEKVAVQPQQGTMHIGAEVYLYLHEPVTGVKMWVKKLDYGVETVKYGYAFKRGVNERWVPGSSDGCVPGYTTYDYYDTGEFLFDGRVEAFSDRLKKIYPQVMQATWTYLNTDEMMDLNSKTPEIREKKVY
ncbi:MAG: hypothetical protein WA162_04870 [Thermodesulfobacteriota bacterium]